MEFKSQDFIKSQLKKLPRKPIVIFWFRRDLRLDDNAALYEALKLHSDILPIFIFDSNILKSLEKRDARVLFIHKSLIQIKSQLQNLKSDLCVLYGDPLTVFKELNEFMQIQAIYANHDYEPAACNRDQKVAQWALSQQISFLTYKDQCIFEKKEVVTDQQKNYTVFTPYKKKWLNQITPFYLKSYANHLYQDHYLKVSSLFPMPTLSDIGFEDFQFLFPTKDLKQKMLSEYNVNRDFPALFDATSHLGIHLRFGTFSPRELAREGQKHSDVWLSELIWRDFFMQIIWHYPQVVESSFRPQFEKVKWRENSEEFEKWCLGQTGYPLVDAGMRELNQTGHMHNRVRMVVASFLTKHLLMHWRLGEKYFASKLLDYDLSANNGNWQWAAGTGCDAAPYFRVFNPTTQLEKFDADLIYVKKWVPEYGKAHYVKPIVDHVYARERALKAFDQALKPQKKNL